MDPMTALIIGMSRSTPRQSRFTGMGEILLLGCILLAEILKRRLTGDSPKLVWEEQPEPVVIRILPNND